MSHELHVQSDRAQHCCPGEPYSLFKRNTIGGRRGHISSNPGTTDNGRWITTRWRQQAWLAVRASYVIELPRGPQDIHERRAETQCHPSTRGHGFPWREYGGGILMRTYCCNSRHIFFVVVLTQIRGLFIVFIAFIVPLRKEPAWRPVTGEH